MSAASVDLVSFLPAPPTKANRGACQLLEGQLLAYATGVTVVIIDVRIPPLKLSQSRH